MTDLSMNATQILDLSRNISTDHLLKETANKHAKAKMAASESANADTIKGNNFDTQMKNVANGNKENAGIKKASKELEAVFLSQMLSPVFENMGTDPLFGGGHAEKVYRGMMVQEYGKSMAENGGIGLQKYIAAQIEQYQEGVK